MSARNAGLSSLTTELRPPSAEAMFFEFLPVGAAETEQSAATLFLDQVSCGQLYEVSGRCHPVPRLFVCLRAGRHNGRGPYALCLGAQLVITNLTGLYR